MSYRIRYQPMRKNPGSACLRHRRAMLTVFCFFLFLMMVCNLWTDGRKAINDLLAFLRPNVVVSAMNEMAKQFQDGVNIVDAVENAFDNLIQEETFVSG